MQQTNEHTGQDVPYWGYLDIGLFFMVPAALGVLLRLAVRFRFLSRTEFVTPSVSLQLSVIAILLVALYSILRLRYHRPVWTTLGWTFPRVRHSLVAVLFGPMFAVLVVMSAPRGSNPIGYSWVDFALLAALAGPFLEESFVRGCLLPLLLPSLGSTFSVLATAFLFASLHGPHALLQWFWYLATGTVYGCLRLASGTTTAPWLMHSTYNLGLFLFQAVLR
jgi:membrane protease YdiL (CAAX protease family)